MLMTTKTNLLDLAIQYHDALPDRIRQYLHSRAIPDETIDSFLLGWNGWRITIPVYNREGLVAFFRLAKDPEDTRPSPEMLSSLEATVELYGWERLLEPASRIVVCEGELDRLLLEAPGLPCRHFNRRHIMF